jgi:ribosomal protein L37AE/L43A
MCTLPTHRDTSLKEQKGKESVRKVQDRITTGFNSLICPFCEAHELKPSVNNAAHCPSCGAVLSGALLGTLIWISQLPLVIGHHACECGHPEMRRLPDGVYRCPACASEVTPVSRPS